MVLANNESVPSVLSILKTLLVNDRETSYTLSIGLEINTAKDSWEEYTSCLSETEHEYFNQKITSEAKNSFCLGRIAAKKALSKFTTIPFQQTSIETGIFGFPVFDPNPTDFCVSIGHTENAGVAICYKEKLLCGIDIEFLDPKKNVIMQSIFTESELRIKRPAGLDDTAFFHFLWASREALSKSIKTGFLIPIHLFEVSEIIYTDHYYTVYFKNFSLMKGIIFLYGMYIIAVVIPFKLDIAPDFKP